MNPSRGLIMNQWAMYGNVIPMDFVPQVPDGHILIFPSWIEHFVPVATREKLSQGMFIYENHL